MENYSVPDHNGCLSRSSEPLIDEIEIIEITTIDHNEEKRNDHKNQENVDSKITGKRILTKSKTKCKPRFKPHKNKRGRKSEKEAIAVQETKTQVPGQNEECTLEKSDSKCKSSQSHPVASSNTKEQFPEFRVPGCSSCNKSVEKDEGKVGPGLHSTTRSSYSENRFVFHASNGKSEHHDASNFIFGMRIEDAQKEQERLLKSAAARVRTQTAFHVTSEPNRLRNRAHSVTFSTIVRNVHIQHSDHWKYRNHYSRLGLPRCATEPMIKSQYRRLARVYHPDRNIGKPDTKHKFQAVTESYNCLINT